MAVMLLLCACQASNHAPVTDLSLGRAPVSQGVHVVRSGDTLYSIAWRYGRDYQKLAALNSIPPPYRIVPGQRITLDSSRVEPPVKRPTPAAQPSRPQTGGYKKPPANDKPIQEKVANQRDNRVNISWQWPATGTVLRRFSMQGAAVNKGIDIAGQRGDPVLAAAPGKVVYSGPGMVGYGNLIIIKHNDDLLSAYAHNSVLRVDEGEVVKAGQRIAEIGSSGTTRNQLHFEIRRNGKPVDPLFYLPKR